MIEKEIAALGGTAVDLDEEIRCRYGVDFLARYELNGGAEHAGPERRLPAWYFWGAGAMASTLNCFAELLVLVDILFGGWSTLHEKLCLEPERLERGVTAWEGVRRKRGYW
ncbi:hypothetical protein CS8_002180 [Cupriavidus sp. 8B]